MPTLREQFEAFERQRGDTPAAPGLEARFQEYTAARERARQNGVRAAFMGVGGLTADEAAKVVDLHVRTGGRVPIDVIRRDTAAVEDLVSSPREEIDRILAESPVLAGWVQDDPRVVPPLIQDETARLRGIEWLFKAPIAAFAKSGLGQVEYGFRTTAQLHGADEMAAGLIESGGERLDRRGARARMSWGLRDVARDLLAGDVLQGWFKSFASEANEERIAELERTVLNRYYGDEGFFERGLIGFAEMLPQIGGAAASSLVGPALSLVVGQAGPQAATAEEAVTVPLSARLGPAVWSYIQEAGPAYRELSQIPGVDEGTAKKGAYLVGAANAALETLSFFRIARLLPGGRAALDRQATTAVREALRRRSFREALRLYGRDYAGAVGTETITEMAQEATAVIAGAVAREVSPDAIETTDWSSEWERIVGVGLKTFETMVVGGPLLQGPTVVSESMAARRAARSVGRLQTLVDASKDAKLWQRSPEHMREFLRRNAERGEIRNVFVSVEGWDAAAEKLGADPADLAERVLGTTEGYREARETGGDLVIPIEHYIEKIGRTDLHGSLTEHVRLYQGDSTLAEIERDGEARAEDLKTFLDLVPDEYSADERAVYDEEYSKVLSATGDAVQADAYGRLHTAVLRTLARRTGMGLLDLHGEYTVTIGPGTEASGLETATGEAVRLARDGDTALLQRIALVRRGDRDALFDAAADLAPKVESGTILVPVPNDAGDTADNADLAREVARLSGGRVADVLRGRRTNTTTETDRLDQAAPSVLPPDNPRENPDALARWMAANGGIDPNEEGVWRENYKRYPGLARREGGGLTFDAWGERLKEEWPHIFETRDEAFEWLRDEWQFGSRTVGPERPAAIEEEIAEMEAEAEADFRAAVEESMTALRVAGYDLDRETVEEVLLGEGVESVTEFDLEDGEAVFVPEHRDVFTVERRRTDEGEVTVLRDGTTIELDDFSTVRVFRLGEGKGPATVEDLAGTENVVLIDAVRTTGRRIENARQVLPRARYLAWAQLDPGSGTLLGQDAGPTMRLFQPRSVEGTRLGQGKRGYIEFGPDRRRFDIRLLENADRTTLFHETAHFYLELLGDLASRTDAAEDVRADYDAALKWLGVESRDQIGTEQHEKWARGFEAYLMSGKAPSAVLAEVFAKIKAWMLIVYRHLRNLDVELSPEIVRVFDRLVASEEEMAEAERLLEYQPIQKLRESMTQAEWEEYSRTVRQADEDGRNELRRRLMEEEQREVRAWFREEKDRIRAEVERELAQAPEYRALAYLQTGEIPGVEIPDALEDADGNALKLDRAAIVAAKGEDFLKLLPRPYVYRKAGGVDPADLAGALGFDSGDALLEALAGARPWSREVVLETRRRIRDRYGDLLEEKNRLVEEAVDAAHNESRTEQILVEARVIRRELEKAGAGKDAPKRLVPLDELRQRAEDIIKDRRVRDVRPYQYQRQEQKYGRQAFRAMERGDLAAAYDAKQRQLWNHALYRAARDAKVESERAVRYLNRMGTKGPQSRLGRAGHDYQEQVNAILGLYSFRALTGKAVDRLASLRVWIDEQRREGHEAVIDPQLLARTERIHYQELSVDELAGVRDAVRNIEHLAKLKVTLLVGNDRRSFRLAKAEMEMAARENLPMRRGFVIDPDTRSGRQRAIDILERVDSKMLKVEEMIRRLDGNDPEGPWSRYLWDPIARAQTEENDLTAEIVRKLMDLRDSLPRDVGRRMSDQVFIERISQSMTRGRLIAVALNTGNSSNLDKLVRGRQNGPDMAPMETWDHRAIDEMLSHLTEADWDYVQGMWDTIESLWPRIEALEKRLTGIAPPKVEARPFTRTFTREDGSTYTKSYRGGYYPVVYDRRQSNVGRKQAEAGTTTSEIFDAGYVRAMTPHGHTIERVQSFARPLDLSPDAAIRHLSQVIHDVTHREAVLSVHKLLTDDHMIGVLHRHLGEAYAKTLIPWLKTIANDRNPIDPDFAYWENIAGRARSNVTMVGIGFRATTMLQNFSNIGNAIEAVPVKYLGPAYSEFIQAVSSGRRSELVETIHEKSGEIRHRFNNMDRDIRDQLKKILGKRGIVADAQRFAYHGIWWTDSLTVYPTWLAAYRQALDEGKSEDGAIKYADRTIRLSFGSGAAKDLAAVQRNGELARLLTMFYTYFSAIYNRSRALGSDARQEYAQHGLRRPRALWRILSRSFFLFAFVAITSELLSGRGPDGDDPEDWAKWASWKVGTWPMLTMPIARQAVGMVEFGRGTSDVPLIRVLESVVNAGTTTVDVATGDRDLEDLGKPALRASGYLFGIPTGQVEITGGYMVDLMRGKDEPESFWEFTRNTLYRRRD